MEKKESSLIGNDMVDDDPRVHYLVSELSHEQLSKSNPHHMLSPQLSKMTKDEILDLMEDKGLSQFTAISMYNYLVKGHDPGDFLYHVLINDLFTAFGYADDHNRRYMFELVKFMYNWIPAASHGSRKDVRKWMEMRGNPHV